MGWGRELPWPQPLVGTQAECPVPLREAEAGLHGAHGHGHCAPGMAEALGWWLSKSCRLQPLRASQGPGRAELLSSAEPTRSDTQCLGTFSMVTFAPQICGKDECD